MLFSLVSDAPIHEDAADEISLKSRVSSFTPYGQQSRNPTLKVRLITIAVFNAC